MASRLDLTYPTYAPTVPPRDTGGLAGWVYKELTLIGQLLSQLAIKNPQVAYKAPATPLAGMIRLAKQGWDPTSFTGYDPDIGAWVRFNGTSWEDF